ncbi:hypothetical protein GDO86_011762 [Hymenochirus boettgeri]|uniref:Leucine rich repeat containing 72 n=1 Tax=Hymenochirus boettgeri TaxID=247094 RepID=A0A8T2JIB3_9PIPI|nr:hypothetical protein GDO86_011762 [Hymenochirus boettgeri]
MLKFLWLNHNKITRITGLANNWRLSELYLDNNELCDITGCLRHLTSLHTLLLNDNQLVHLQETVKELKGMTNIRVLNLFHNPLTQESGYRLYIINHIPSVQRLDRKRVIQKEREDAFKLFNPERTAVIQSLGFGRRTDSALTNRKSSGTYVQRSVASSLIKHSAFSKHPDELEDEVLMRAYQRSILQFSLVDWTKIPSFKEKGTEDKMAYNPVLMTLEFR